MPAGQGYANLGEAIGLALGGGDIDREGARLEGLNAGSQINLRRAQTDDALSRARQRVDEANRLQEVEDNADQLSEALGVDRNLIMGHLAGLNPQQLTGAAGDVQEQGFRDTISNPELAIPTRQAAAQAVHGQPLSASDMLGPGGELAFDVFSLDPTGATVTPTGESQIGFDEARATESLADAALADEKRTNPAAFRSPGTTVQIGGDTLPETITNPEGSLSLGDDVGYAFGITGAAGQLANAFDVIPGVGQAFPDVAQTTVAMNALRENSMVTGTLDFPGRPTNFIAQRVDALFPPAANIFQGDVGARVKVQQLRDLMSRERDAQMALLPSIQTKSNIDKATASVAQLSQLVADYDQFLAAIPGGEGEGEEVWQTTESGVRYRVVQ